MCVCVCVFSIKVLCLLIFLSRPLLRRFNDRDFTELRVYVLLQVASILKANRQQYKLFETEWLTMVTEDCVDDLHQALLAYEHVVAVIVRRQVNSDS